MKARRLNELRQLVTAPDFKTWHDALVEARRSHAEARERHEELLSQAMLMDFRAELSQKDAIDIVYGAGDLEAGVAKDAAEAQELENASLKVVAEFEEQRFRASEAWFRTCALEKQLEAARAEHAANAPPEPARHEAVRRAERALAEADHEYRREETLKKRLWDEVERHWSRSAELSLLIAEKKVRGKKVRASAERLFKQSDERKGRAARLREEAEAVAKVREQAAARAAQVLKSGAERFGCGLGEDFLYARQKENPKRAWCVPLADDSDSYNIEVKALTIYSIDLKRGVEFVEPAVEARPSQEEGDRRFDEYFLQGRKGRARPSADDARRAS